MADVDVYRKKDPFNLLSRRFNWHRGDDNICHDPEADGAIQPIQPLFMDPWPNDEDSWRSSNCLGD